MKRNFTCFSLVLCIILSMVLLTACSGGTKWLRPNFNYEGEGLTIELVTNMEKDFEFPIKGVKFDHSKFADESIFEYGWVIYDDDHEIVGWIEAGNGYDRDRKGNYSFGWSAYYVAENTSSSAYFKGGEYGYWNANFCVFLKSKDMSIFDHIEFASDYGTVKMNNDMENNPLPSSDRFPKDYNAETDSYDPAEGSEDYVCCFYLIEGVDPNETQNVKITLSFKAE